MLVAGGTLSSESALYISHVNFRALHAAGNAFYAFLVEKWMSMNESVTEILRFFLPTFHSPPLAL